MKKADIKYTLVQHSAFGYKGDRTFARAVEERMLHSQIEIDRVKKAGGLVFDHYPSDEEYDVNYPEGTNGLVPQVRGTFSDRLIDGLRIYVPAASEKIK